MNNYIVKPNKIIIAVEIIIVTFMSIVAFNIKQYNKQLTNDYLLNSTVIEQIINIMTDEKYFYHLSLGLISIIIFVGVTFFLIKYSGIIERVVILIVNTITLIIFLYIFWDPILLTVAIGLSVIATVIYINQN